MGFDAAALRGGLDAWRRQVGGEPVPRPAAPSQPVVGQA
jgi:hypothetical protein